MEVVYGEEDEEDGGGAAAVEGPPPPVIILSAELQVPAARAPQLETGRTA